MPKYQTDEFAYDTPEAIDVCLHCTRQNCTGNCLEMRAARRGETVKRRHNRVLYNADGIGHSVAEWSKITGVAEATINQRLRRGLPLEMAIKNGSLHAAMATARGVERPVKEWAALLGVYASSIHARLKRGESMDSIVDLYEARAERRRGGT